MTISLRAAGTATASGALVTAINPAVPAGATTGDLSILSVALKPYNATMTTPSGWTKITEWTNGTTAATADLGSMKCLVFVQESAAVGAIGNLSFTNADSVKAVINTYQKTGTAWDYSQFCVGSDAANGTNYSATANGGMGLKVGDWIIGTAALNNDLGITGGFTTTFSGATLSAVTNRHYSNTTTGTDCGIQIAEVNVTAVTTSLGTIVYGYTSTTASSGTNIWVRLREVGTPPGPVLAKQQMVRDTVAANTSLVSAPINVVDGDVVIVKVANAGAQVIGTPTATGVTFTSEAEYSAGNKSAVQIFAAVVSGSPAPLVITQPFTGTVSNRSMLVEQWTNATVDATPAANATESGNSIGPSASLTTTAANSAVTWVLADWAAVAQGTIALRSSAELQGTAGGDATTYTSYFAKQDVASAGSTTIGTTTPATAQNWSMVGIEIKSDATGNNLTDSPADTGTGNDAITVEWARDLVLTDTGTGADTISVVWNRDLVLVDTGTGSDNLTASFVQILGLFDTSTGADALTALFDKTTALADTGTGTDLLSYIHDFVQSLPDTGSGTDSLSYTWVRGLLLADTGTGSDSLVATLFKNIIGADTGTGIDNLSVTWDRANSLADTGSGADSLSIIWNRAITIGDTSTGTDSISLLWAKDLPLTDSGVGTDAISVTWNKVVTIGDTSTGTDAISTSGSGGINIGDVSTGTDAISVTWNKVITLADTSSGVDALLVSKLLALADTGTGIDSISFTLNRVLNLADVGTGTDTLNFTINRVLSLSDIGTGTDALTFARDRVLILADIGFGTESFSRIFDRELILADSSSGLDDLVAFLTKVISLVDVGTGIDELTFYVPGIDNWHWSIWQGGQEIQLELIGIWNGTDITEVTDLEITE